MLMDAEYVGDVDGFIIQNLEKVAGALLEVIFRLNS